MKTLSNAELQDAIEHTVRLIRGDGSRSSVILTVHLEALTDEQRRRATDEITLEPMTTTLDRVAFEARAKGPDSYHLSGCWYGGHEAQDRPEWVEWGGGECPVPENHIVDVKFREQRDSNKAFRLMANSFSWLHRPKKSINDVIAYRDWTAWEQSK